MSQLAQAADHLEEMALDATRLPWSVTHHGSRTGSSWISTPRRVVGRAAADDADLVLAAVNALPNLVALLRAIDKAGDTNTAAYKMAVTLADNLLSGE